MNENEQTNTSGAGPVPRQRSGVDQDTELSVAELVDLNRKNLPGTVEEAQQQVSQWSKKADTLFMRIGAHILAVELEKRFYRYGCGGKSEYAEEKLGLASSTWRRYYDAAKIGFALRGLDQKLLMGHCLELANLRVKDERELKEKAPKIIAEAMKDGSLTAPSLKRVVAKENGDEDSDSSDGIDKKTGRRLKLIHDAKKAFDEEKLKAGMNEEQKAALAEYTKAAEKLLHLVG